jgi:hypothetical protein
MLIQQHHRNRMSQIKSLRQLLIAPSPTSEHGTIFGRLVQQSSLVAQIVDDFLLVITAPLKSIYVSEASIKSASTLHLLRH